MKTLWANGGHFNPTVIVLLPWGAVLGFPLERTEEMCLPQGSFAITPYSWQLTIIVKATIALAPPPPPPLEFPFSCLGWSKGRPVPWADQEMAPGAARRVESSVPGLWNQGRARTAEAKNHFLQQTPQWMHSSWPLETNVRQGTLEPERWACTSEF